MGRPERPFDCYLNFLDAGSYLVCVQSLAAGKPFPVRDCTQASSNSLIIFCLHPSLQEDRNTINWSNYMLAVIYLEELLFCQLSIYVCMY